MAGGRGGRRVLYTRAARDDITVRRAGSGGAGGLLRRPGRCFNLRGMECPKGLICLCAAVHAAHRQAQRDARVGMSEPLRNHRNRHSLTEEVARVCVAKRMKTHTRQPAFSS